MDEVEEVEVVEELSLSDSLAAAWDESDEEDDVPRGTLEASDGDDGYSGETPDTDSEELGAADEETVQSKASEDQPEVNPDTESLETPPKSLSPAAREAWNKAPEALKKDIAKRERDYANGMEKYRGNAQRAQQMDQTLAPFQQYMQMNGGPQKSIQGLLQTGASLQMGSPAQKAQLVANLIQQFGVDISTLDNMLVGKAPPQEAQANHAIDQRIQQAVAPYQNMMNQFQQSQQQQAQMNQQQVNNEVTAFSQNPANEFYNDVRGDMADILDMASSNNREMSMQEAYDRACRMNPEVFKVSQTRQSAQNMDKKRSASSSIHGTPSGGGDGGNHADLRSAIADDWDNTGRA
jgi:hypothetical protein